MATHQFSRHRTFDPATGEAVAGGRTTRLEPQPAALLALLASRPGELVTHDDIRRHLWPDGRHVDYAASVHYAMRQIRRALDDSASGHADIETLPRRGYRLQTSSIAPPPPASMPVPAGLTGRAGRRWPVAHPAWAAAALIVAALVAIVERQPNDHHERVVALVRAVHDAIY